MAETYSDFAGIYDELMDNVPYERWCDTVSDLMNKYGVSLPVRGKEAVCGEEAVGGVKDALASERDLVVDLGCGTGTLTELLYQKGYDMIGVDNAPSMLGIAMEKREESGS